MITNTKIYEAPCISEVELLLETAVLTSSNATLEDMDPEVSNKWDF